MAKIVLEVETDLSSVDTAISRSKGAVESMNKEVQQLGTETKRAFTTATQSVSTFDKEIKAGVRDVENLGRATQSMGGKGLDNLRTGTNKIGEGFKNASVQAKNFGSSLDGMVGSFVQANLITGGLSKIGDAFGNAIEVQKQYEKSLQNLSAITGASGADLAFYGDEAIRLGASVEGGAVAAVEAFKLIGSAKPELLQNKEALVAVTESAILLSQAGGLALPDAATRMTDAMNQFGAGAEQADYFVNLLANGAKFGAAEIPDVTDALLKFGVAAKSSNISVKESVAAIEVLGEKGLKGAEAGTALRNVFAKLSATDTLPKEAIKDLQDAGVNVAKLSDKNLSLQERLTELSKIQNNANALTRVFGLENKNAAQSLLQSLPRLEELTGQLDTAGGALEQAAKNMDTLDQRTLEAGNAWDNFTLSLTKGGTGDLMKNIVAGWTNALNGLSQVIQGNSAKFQEAQLIMEFSSRTGIKITKEQAEAAAEYGITLQDNSEGAAKNNLVLLGQVRNYDNLAESIKAAGSSQEDIAKGQERITGDVARFSAQYKAGQISAEQFLASIKLLTAARGKLNALKPIPPVINPQDAEAAEQGIKDVSDSQKKAQDDAAKRAKENADANAKLIKEAEDRKIDAIQNEQVRDEEKAKIDFERKKKDIENSKASEEIKNQALLALDLEYFNKKADIENKYNDEREKKKDEQHKKEIARSEKEADELFELLSKAQDEQAKKESDALNKRIDARKKLNEKYPITKLFEVENPEELLKTLDELEKFGDATIKLLEQQINRALEANEKEIDSSKEKQEQLEEERSELEDKLSGEQELRDEGFANDTIRTEQEIARKNAEIEAEKQREAALVEERKKQLKFKLAIDSAQQISSLATAGASLFAAEAPKGVAGAIAAAAAIVGMLAAFLALKNQLAAINSGSGFAEGGYTGDGGKYDIAGSVHRGEYVMTKEKTQKHRTLLDGLHEDNPALIKKGIFDLLKDTKVVLPEADEISNKKIAFSTSSSKPVTIDNSGIESRLDKLEEHLSILVKQGDESDTALPDGSIIRKKGTHKQTIRKNGNSK